jgi:hypothetical protein
MRLAGLCLLAVLVTGCARQVVNEYVAANTCAGCHPKIAATYRATGMARAFYKPREELVRNSRYFHKKSGLNFEIIHRDGKFIYRRWEGADSNVEELQVDYVMGSGNKVRTFLHQTVRGTLIELRSRGIRKMAEPGR